MKLMLTAVNQAIKSATWFTETDEAAVELARHYAELIDTSIRNDDTEQIKKAHAIAGPNLQKTLASLGLTPIDRVAREKLMDQMLAERAEREAKQAQEQAGPPKSKMDEIAARRRNRGQSA